MNKCAFTGRLVRDPELHTFASGKKKVKFSIAVNQKFKNAAGEWESDPSFLDFEAWDTAAETIANRYKKGDFILIDDASIKTERWEDKNTQQPRSKLVFRCNHFELLPLLNSRDEADTPANESEKPQRSVRSKTKAAVSAADDFESTSAGGEDDIPF